MMFKKLLNIGCLMLSFGLNLGYGQVEEKNVYIVQGNDSSLSRMFIQELCQAARTKSGWDANFSRSDLETLILMAAGTDLQDSLKATKTKKWHSKFGRQCQCGEQLEFPKGDFLRQVVHSNFRAFANRVGPNNDLALDLTQKSPVDNLTIYQYVNKERKRLEAKHHDLRFEFQQDEEWRNIMFFYFLFAEFSIN
ncbi:MAG: hypothetical protein AAFN93_03950 [Bacteroidota bacterium]